MVAQVVSGSYSFTVCFSCIQYVYVLNLYFISIHFIWNHPPNAGGYSWLSPQYSTLNAQNISRMLWGAVWCQGNHVNPELLHAKYGPPTCWVISWSLSVISIMIIIIINNIVIMIITMGTESKIEIGRGKGIFLPFTHTHVNPVNNKVFKRNSKNQIK